MRAPGAISLGAFEERASAPELVGYAIGHPWRGDPPGLWREVPAAPEARGGPAGSSGATYALLHDLCVSPAAQGSGLGKALGSAWLRAAREARHSRFQLVAVSRREGFWERLGFRASADDGLQGRVGACHGEGATAMHATWEEVEPAVRSAIPTDGSLA